MKAIVILGNRLSSPANKIVVVDILAKQDTREMLEDIFYLLSNPECKTPATFPSMASGDIVVFPELGKTFKCEFDSWSKIETFVHPVE